MHLTESSKVSSGLKIVGINFPPKLIIWDYKNETDTGQ